MPFFQTFILSAWVRPHHPITGVFFHNDQASGLARGPYLLAADAKKIQ